MRLTRITFSENAFAQHSLTVFPSFEGNILSKLYTLLVWSKRHFKVPLVRSFNFSKPILLFNISVKFKSLALKFGVPALILKTIAHYAQTSVPEIQVYFEMTYNFNFLSKFALIWFKYCKQCANMTEVKMEDQKKKFLHHILMIVMRSLLSMQTFPLKRLQLK